MIPHQAVGLYPPVRPGGDGFVVTKDLSYGIGVGVGVGVAPRVLSIADTLCLTAEIPRT
jgi:hypothetical protein